MGLVRSSVIGASVATFVILQACSSDPPAESGPSGGGPDGGGPGRDGGGEQDALYEEAPTVPAIRYVGRFDTTDPKGPKVSWPGARIIVRFKGTKLSVKTDETNLYRGPSHYDVIVDGKVRDEPFVPEEGTNDHIVVEDLAEGAHVVELWRRTEAFVGVTQFLGFDYGGGELLPPPAPSKRHIEFVGDSSSAGYGSECTSWNDGYDGATSNERITYAAIAARDLDAEHHNLSYSGKGIYRNNDPSDPVVYPDLYGRTLADDEETQWSFASWKADVVVIGLGSNDWADTDGRPKPNNATFKAEYHKLVTLVRSKHPNAQILCTVPASFSDYYPAGYDTFTNFTTILKAVVEERHEPPYDDPKVHYHELPRAAEAVDDDGNPDLSGCSGHSNRSFHAKLGKDITAKIKSIAGW